MDEIADNFEPPIKMDYSATKAHVPEAERNNRVLKERIRASFHRLHLIVVVCLFSGFSRSCTNLEWMRELSFDVTGLKIYGSAKEVQRFRSSRA